MSIHHSIDQGGTFGAVLPVNADLFFLNTETNIFAEDPLHAEMDLTATGVPWLFFPEIELVTIDEPIQLINGTTVPPTSSNFHPGVTITVWLHAC
ncbi:MAG: hypothetical protein IH987_07230 [Planctomycetes bacterium]|nr:hypothetical protein [Planctomycetota bacterium]